MCSGVVCRRNEWEVLRWGTRERESRGKETIKKCVSGIDCLFSLSPPSLSFPPRISHRAAAGRSSFRFRRTRLRRYRSERRFAAGITSNRIAEDISSNGRILSLPLADKSVYAPLYIYIRLARRIRIIIVRSRRELLLLVENCLKSERRMQRVL